MRRRALAAELDALTTTSALAMGFFDGPTALGISGGFASDVTARHVEQADAVLVLGAGLNPFTTRFGDAFGASGDRHPGRPSPKHPRTRG